MTDLSTPVEEHTHKIVVVYSPRTFPYHESHEDCVRVLEKISDAVVLLQGPKSEYHSIHEIYTKTTIIPYDWFDPESVKRAHREFLDVLKKFGVKHKKIDLPVFLMESTISLPHNVDMIVLFDSDDYKRYVEG